MTRNHNARAAILLAIAALAAYVVAMAIIGSVLDPTYLDWLFSETGPFEQASEWLWLGLALLCLIRVGWRGTGAGLAAAATVLAMREADWHKAFTTDSIFKTNYYLDTHAPLAEKAAGLAVAAACFTLLAWLAVTAWRHLVTRRRYREPWGALAVAGAVLLPLIKVLDRAPAMLAEEVGVVLPTTAQGISSAIEEGVEAVLPILFAVAALVWTPRHRAGDRHSEETG